MNNNRLYHRQCFRRHERSCGSQTVSDIDSQFADSSAAPVVSVLQDVGTSDRVSVDKAVSSSTPSEIKYSDTSSTVNTVDCTSSSPECAAVPESCLPSCETSVMNGEVLTSFAKPSIEDALNVHAAAVNSSNHISAAAADDDDDDISLQEMSAASTRRQQTDLSVLTNDAGLASQPTAAAVATTELPLCQVMSAEASDDLGLHLPQSVGFTLNPTESAVTYEFGALEQLQNGVNSETRGKMLPEQAVNTPLPVVASLDGESCSLSSAAAAVAAESVEVPEVMPRRAPVSPRFRQHALIDVAVTTQQPTSSSLDVHPSASSPSVKLLDGAVSASLSSTVHLSEVHLSSKTASVSTHDISSTVPVAAFAVSAPLSSESSSTAFKSSHRVVPRRPAPLPPEQMQEKRTNSPITLIKESGHLGSITATSELSESMQHEISAADLAQQVSDTPAVHAEQGSYKEAVAKPCEEQTAVSAVTGCSRPVPISRCPQTPKPVDSTPTHPSSLTPPVITMTDSDNSETVAVKPLPVPKPRKSMLFVTEPDEMGGKGGMMVKHEDVELCQDDGLVTVRSDKRDNVITGSSVPTAAAAATAAVKITPSVCPRSPEVGMVSSSQLTCKENKSPSSSPTVPVKYPRSKKHHAAPKPPTPVTPKLPSPKPETSSTAKPESPAPDIPPRLAKAAASSSQLTNKDGGRSPGLTNKIADKPAAAAYLQQSPAVNSSAPVRRKITPGKKFTFKNDVFRGEKSAVAVETSAAEHLKPSRPAPPRPPTFIVTKRKVLTMCMRVSLLCKQSCYFLAVNFFSKTSHFVWVYCTHCFGFQT